MTGGLPSNLLEYLTERYASLKARLTRRLGNPDLASDALHDTYLRLQAMDELPEREQPAAYLVRVATNIALNMQSKDGRTATGDEIEAVLEEFADPAPGPERIAQARLDLSVAKQFVDRMPARRRAIMLMVHWEEIPRPEVAQQLGISRRTLEYELQRAHARLDQIFRESEK